VAQQFFNNFDTTLSVALATGVTSMTVDDATGLPVTLGVGNSYLLTLSDGPVETIWEIVLVDTDRSGNVITITREQEGTTMPASWPIGTFVSARVTAATMDTAIAGGGGGGGSGTELDYDNWLYFNGDDPADGALMDIPADGALMDIFYSKDGGFSWLGDRRDNADGIGGTDTEDPKFAFGSGFHMPAMVTWGTATV
jgi:hypothetical protein